MGSNILCFHNMLTHSFSTCKFHGIHLCCQGGSQCLIKSLKLLLNSIGIFFNLGIVRNQTWIKFPNVRLNKFIQPKQLDHSNVHMFSHFRCLMLSELLVHTCKVLNQDPCTIMQGEFSPSNQFSYCRRKNGRNKRYKILFLDF